MADAGLLEAACLSLSRGEGSLLVVQTAFLGDVVLLTPLLRAAKKAFPTADLTALVIPQCRDVALGWVDRVITVDKRNGGKEVWSQLLAELKRGRFAATLLPHRSVRTGMLARRAGIVVRIGFDRGGGSFLHTHRVPYTPTQYEGRRNLALLKPLAEVSDEGLPELKLTAGLSSDVDRTLAEIGVEAGRFVVIAPGSVWATKQWPPDHYRELASLLKSDYGLETVAVGGDADRDVSSRTVANVALNLAGRLTPLQSAAVMSRSRLVVSGDTAAAHLATAVGARQVVIFGSTSPRFGFLPPTPTARALGLDLWCRPCSHHGRRRCPRARSAPCLMGITPEAVAGAVRDWLE